MSAGSLHSDQWSGPAIILLSRDIICIKPLGGWWKERATADVRAKKARYSLVLSLRSQDGEIDLHTPISTMIEAEVGIESFAIPTSRLPSGRCAGFDDSRGATGGLPLAGMGAPQRFVANNDGREVWKKQFPDRWAGFLPAAVVPA